MSNDDYGRNVAAQVQQSMEFHRSFALAKLGPREERKTQVDGRGIEGVNRLLQRKAEVVVAVKLSGLFDEQMSEIGIDSPIADRVGVCQRIARDPTADAHVIKLALLSS